jgi:hypothetical protein
MIQPYKGVYACPKLTRFYERKKEAEKAPKKQKNHPELKPGLRGRQAGSGAD